MIDGGCGRRWGGVIGEVVVISGGCAIWPRAVSCLDVMKYVNIYLFNILYMCFF